MYCKPLSRLTIFLVFSLLSCQLWGQTNQSKVGWTAEQYAKTDSKAFFQLKSVQDRINFATIDLGLLNAAVFYETNKRRQEAGLPALAWAAALEKAAKGHAQEMVTLNYFSHESPTAGRKTFNDRFGLEGITLGYRGENIAKGFGLDYELGRKLFPPETTGAGFRYSLLGEDLKPHSYQSAAKALLDQWMASAPHKANILNAKFTYLGCAVINYKATEYAGMDYLMAVQDFSSYPGNN